MENEVINLENYTFMANKRGKLTLVLPSMVGKPLNPRAKINNENELLFARNTEIILNLKNLNQNTLEILNKVKKFLVVEVNPEAAANMILEEKPDTNENILEASTNIYEVELKQ